jgi:hypothetical protein
MPTISIKTVRYVLGSEVFAEVAVPTGLPFHLSPEVYLGGLYCSCKGAVLAAEPDVLILDCVPFQYHE